MRDSTKTKTQLLNELKEMRQRVFELEQSEAKRKQAEEALQKGEECFRQIYQNMAIGVARVTLEFCIESANDAYCHMLGYREDELIGKHLKDITHPEILEENLQKQALLAAGKIDHYRMEKQFIHKNGRIVYGILDANLVRDTQGQPVYFIGSVLDITENKRAEEALRESHERLFTILNSIDADVYVSDMETYEILFTNQHMQTHFGEDVVGKACWDVFRDNSGPCIHCTNNQLIDADGNPAEVVIWEAQNPITGKWYINYDRAIQWMDGRIVRLQVATDITERKQVEIALRESEERYKFLAENMADIVWTLDQNFNTTYVSPSIQKVLGFTPEERKQQTLEEAITPESVQQTIMLFAEEMQRDIEPNTDLERYVSIETEYYHADGQTVWMENSVKAIRGHSGAIIGIYGSSRDITDRKRVEAALIEGETQFRTLFESSPIGIGVVDHQGNLLLFNDAMLQSGGFSATDIQEIGNVAALYQNSDQRNEALKRFQEQGFLKNFPAQFKRKDGTYYDALLSLSHLHFRGKPCIQAIVQDITERKRTEEALQESQRRLSTLMSNLPGMAYRCMNDPNWTMEFVSDGCLPLTGYKPDELVGNAQLSYAEIIHPEDRQIVWDTVQAGLKTQRSFQLLYRIITASKNIKWVWEQGQGILGTENDVITLEGFITDITDRVQIESTLRENEARLKDAQRVAHVGNWELDLVTGKLWWSDEVYRIFGVQPQEFKATYDAFLSHVYPDDRDFVNDAYTASVKNNQPYNIVHRLQTKDGSIKYINERCETEYDASGQALRSMGTVQDITDRVQAENALKKYAAQLETLNTIAAALTTSLELDQVLELILDQIGKVILFDSGAIFLYEDAGLRVMVDRNLTRSPRGHLFPGEDELFAEILQTHYLIGQQFPGGNTIEIGCSLENFSQQRHRRPRDG